MTHQGSAIDTSTPEMTCAWLDRGEILLIDVREPHEYAFERIHGAVLYPLSTFDPRTIPADGRKLVIHCASGKRSMNAAHRLVAAGHSHVTNLEGGIQAWKAVGLPVIRIDPQTGRLVDDGRRTKEANQ
jgi:rhodanese-related sulfurtransferase